MIYCHYENFTINTHIDGTITKLTKLVFSSHNISLNMYGKYNFEILKAYIFAIKQIPVSERTYDPKYKIWIILTDKFEVLKRLWESTHPNMCISHPDLKLWIEGKEGYKSEFEAREEQKPEDFFYSTSQPVGQPKVDMETARKQFVDFLIRQSIQVFENGDLIKSYKLAARKLHPDLNGGDSSKMSELNMLWQQYKQLKTA